MGKLIVHAPTRPEAIATMRRALDELVIEGVQTTIPLHRRIFRDADFIAGRVDTTWVERVLLCNEAMTGWVQAGITEPLTRYRAGLERS